MSLRRKIQAFLITTAWGLFVTGSAFAIEPTTATPVEHESKWWSEGQGRSLGTIRYSYSEKEQSFFDRLTVDETLLQRPVEAQQESRQLVWAAPVGMVEPDRCRVGRRLNLPSKLARSLPVG